MKKLTLTTLIYLIVFQLCAQKTDLMLKNKTFIFDYYSEGKECDLFGKPIANDVISFYKGSLFVVERITEQRNLIIRFLVWRLPSNEQSSQYSYAKEMRHKFNFIADPAINNKVAIDQHKNVKFFLITMEEFDRSTSEYHFPKKWDITFGTMTTPFKFRKDPALFTTNLNLGASVSYERKISTNWSWGIIGGLSLSSVQLDSLSTKGSSETTTDRPAFTPSIHGLLGFKNINITIGLGWDKINVNSDTEAAWLYNGKRWVGIGIGIGLFKEDKGDKDATTKQDQKSN